MSYARPHIQVNHLQKVIAVFWSPPFEGVLNVPSEDVEPYYKAYRLFEALIQDEKRTVQFKLQQGECIVFNQRRYDIFYLFWKSILDDLNLG